MKLSHIIIVTILLALMSGGCRSSRNAAGHIPETPLPAGATLRQHYERVVGSYGDWSDVSVPVSITMSSPSNISLSGRVNMVRGKLIDISLRMFGMEVGRLYITTDSLYAKIRPGKTYVAEPLAVATSQVPLTIENVQDMLTGRIWILGDGKAGGDYRRFDMERGSVSGEWIAIPKKQPAQAHYGFALSDDDVVKTLMITVLNSDIVCTARYDDCVYTDPSGEFASRVNVATSGKKKLDATIQWKWSSAKWNEGVDKSWDTPSGYKRMKVADMLKKGIS